VRGFERLADDSAELALVEAFRTCRCRWGSEKTTVEDVAREAGVSRATLYRVFPGGRPALVDAAKRHELADFIDRLDDAVADLDSLEDALAGVLVTAARLLADDDEFQDALANRPSEVIPTLTFRGADPVFAAARIFGAQRLAPWCADAADAAHLSELVARIILIHVLEPDDPPGDLTDADYARSLVVERILPGATQGAPS